MNKNKSNVVPIGIELTDVITPKSCSSLIVELIKFVAYNKQQIPYPYERLKMYVLKRRERLKRVELSNSKDPDMPLRVAFLMEKYYKKVEEAFEILESTFKCIEDELINSNECPIEEVVLLFGATPITPKDVYRIQVPSLSYGHLDGRHAWKRQIGNLFREIIVSDEVNANLHRKVGLTNMFVMLKVKKGGCADSKWLLPKDYYKLSDRARQICFSFQSLSSKPCNCFTDVNQFEALSQRMANIIVDNNDVPCRENSVCSGTTFESDDQFVWFQAHRSLKGFKDCKSQGTSVTDLWYRYSFIS